MNAPPELQRLVDRMAIQDVLVRYYHGADTGDRAVVRSCFTQDVRAHYDGRPPVSGVDALIDQIAIFRNLETGACTICTHFLGNLRFVHLDANTAETESHVFACLVVPEDQSSVVNLRSLRYLDRWRLENGEWKISVREHTLDWSCQLPTTAARTFAQRLRGIPEHGSTD